MPDDGDGFSLHPDDVALVLDEVDELLIEFADRQANFFSEEARRLFREELRRRIG